MRIAVPAALLGAALASTPVAAQDTARDPVKNSAGRNLAATCAICHGTEGRGIRDSALPPLAGMPAGYLGAQMRAFRDGKRPATVMHQLARGYSDPQIDAIAAWFAAQKR